MFRNVQCGIVDWYEAPNGKKVEYSFLSDLKKKKKSGYSDILR